jgi:hypothetical protein
MTNTRNKIHINAVFQAVDMLFSEIVPVEEIKETDKLVAGLYVSNSKQFKYRSIDTNNDAALSILAQHRLNQFLKQHRDNTLELFVEQDLERAILMQTALTKYKTDDTQKTYWYMLERWCKVLMKMLPQQAEAKPKKLGVPQIALIHIYEGIAITKENAGKIAAKYGYTAKTSGIGLYHDYLKYSFTSDRTAKPTAETKKTLENKIKLFESVLNHLSNKAKQQAIDEINILKTILENEYQ